MGGRAGGGAGLGSRGSYKGSDGIVRYNLPKGYTDVHQVAKVLRLYTPMDRWNRNTAYSMGFNDTAHQLVETIAKGDFGLATTISKQATQQYNRQLHYQTTLHEGRPVPPLLHHYLPHLLHQSSHDTTQTVSNV